MSAGPTAHAPTSTYTSFSVKQTPVWTNFHGIECQEKPGPPCSTVVPAAELRAAPHQRRVRSEALPVIFCIAAASRGGEVPQRGLLGRVPRSQSLD